MFPILVPLGDAVRLVPFQSQELGVRSKDFGDRILELPATHHAGADRIEPVFRDALDMLFPLDHKSERPNGVALALGAMTGRLAATPVGERQGTRQTIGSYLEA
jgi:hypothetical protein